MTLARAREVRRRAEDLDAALRVLDGADPVETLARVGASGGDASSDGDAGSDAAGSDDDGNDAGSDGAAGGDDGAGAMTQDEIDRALEAGDEMRRRVSRLGADAANVDAVRALARSAEDLAPVVTRARTTLCAARAASRAAAASSAPPAAEEAAIRAAEAELLRLARRVPISPGCPACLERHRELASAEHELATVAAARRALDERRSAARARRALQQAADTLGARAARELREAMDSLARAEEAKEIEASVEAVLRRATEAASASRSRKAVARREAVLRHAAQVAIRLQGAGAESAQAAGTARALAARAQKALIDLEAAARARDADIDERRAVQAREAERTRTAMAEVTELDTRAGAAMAEARQAERDADAWAQSDLERRACNAFADRADDLLRGHAAVEAEYRSFRYHVLRAWMPSVLSAVNAMVATVDPGLRIAFRVRQVKFVSDPRRAPRGRRSDCDEVIYRKGSSVPEYAVHWLLERPGREATPMVNGSGFETAICSFALRAVVSDFFLGARTDIVLADEAFGAFDEMRVERVPALLKLLAARGKKVVFVSHSRVLAAETADRVVVAPGLL